MKYLLKECWKDIERYEGLYQISNLGRIKSLGMGNSNNSKERIIKPCLDEKGYIIVGLSKYGKRHTFKVHRLVAFHFIPIPEHLKGIPIEKLDVNHISEVKTDNSVKNLEWCTHQYNIDYSQSKTVLQYDLFGNFIKEWKSCNECGRNGFDFRKVSSCCLGKRNKHKGYIWKYKG